MRILHTADWHLGKKLNFFDRFEEQKAVLAEIVTIAEAQAVDMVIVAGDLFDNAHPGNEATELLYKTLKKLARNGKVPVVAIAGNHDSPSRVNVADVLARENGIIFMGYPTDEVPIFSLENGFSVVKTEPGFIEIKLPNIDFPVRLIHTAYANEMRLKEYFGQDKQASLQDSLQEKWTYLSKKYCDLSGVNLLTTHLYMAKSKEEQPQEPDGERPLNIGTADIVYSHVIPEEIQYAALGHLHKFQDVGVHQPAIYSSAPLSYSFSEAGQQKFVALIEVNPGEEPQIEKIPLTKGYPLKRVRFHEVAEAVEWLEENQETLVELTMETDKFLTADERKQIYQSHERIIFLIPKVAQATTHQNARNVVDVSQRPEILFKDYFKTKNNGQEPNAEIMALFQEILNA